MIIIQAITLIFCQIDSNKIQSCPPLDHLLFTFPLLLKYKTDFPLIIIYRNVSQLRSVRSFVALFLQRFPIRYECIADGSGAARLWPDVSSMATRRSSWQNMKKDHFEQRIKRQFFCQPQEKVQRWLETFGSRMKLRIHVWLAFDSFDVVFQW